MDNRTLDEVKADVAEQCAVVRERIMAGERENHRLRLRVLDLETKLRQLAGRHCPGCAGSCPGLEP